jgi:colanic acid biosynthesis glycosyl transferase WcaI
VNGVKCFGKKRSLNTAEIHIVPQIVVAADLVLPSKLGGMLASGGPIVAMAAAHTGQADEIKDSGLVVPPGDSQALAAAVRALADNIEVRHRLRKSTRHRALEDWYKTAILQCFKHDLSKRSRRDC